MVNKIGAIYKITKNNCFQLQKIGDYDNVKNNHVLEINEEKLDKLKNGEKLEIVDQEIGKSSNITFVLSDSLIQQISAICKEKKLSDIDKYVSQLLDKVFGSYPNIDVKERGGLMALSLEFKSQKKTEEVKDNNNDEKKEKFSAENLRDPNEVIAEIKNKVIAQDQAVQTVVYTIYDNQLHIDKGDAKKMNMILDGPTGTGKTMILTEATKMFDIPCVIEDSTRFSGTGYEGGDTNEILVELLQKTKGDLEKAQRGVVVLDEFDKLAGANTELEMKKAVQQKLLTPMSGGIIPVEYNGKTYDFDTSNLTFIVLGAFTDMREKKIADGLDENGYYTITKEDYIQAGILREIIGRIQMITATQALGKADLIRIMKESEDSALKEFKTMVLTESKGLDEVIIEDDILELIADWAIEENTGARALKSVFSAIKASLNVMIHDDKSDRIVINEEIIQEARKVYQREAKVK